MANVASIAFWRQNAATDLPALLDPVEPDTPPRFTPTCFTVSRALWQGQAQDQKRIVPPLPKPYLYEHNIFVAAFRDPACLWM